jgi:hypothetical protein
MDGQSNGLQDSTMRVAVEATLPIRMKLRIDDPKFRELWLSKRDSLRGKHQVPIYELFTPQFMLRESRLENFDDFVAEAKVRDDVRSVDDMTDEERIAWDLFIRTLTRFTGWPQLLGHASSEWLERKIRGEESPNAAASTSPNNDSINNATPSSEKKLQGPADDFANKIMAKLQASKPIAFQFALHVRLQLKPFESKKGWFPKFNSPARYEEKTDRNGNRSSIFYFDQDQTLFENIELLISYLLKDSAFWEWKKQQPSPPPSIGPAPGTHEANEAKREARIRFMQKAGASEQEIASDQRGLLGNDLFGPGGNFWSILDAFSPAAKGPKVPNSRLTRPARRRRVLPSPEQQPPENPLRTSHTGKPKEGMMLLVRLRRTTQ